MQIITIEIDDDNEPVATVEEVLRQLRDGNTSGGYPSWSIDEEKDDIHDIRCSECNDHYLECEDNFYFDASIDEEITTYKCVSCMTKKELNTWGQFTCGDEECYACN